MKKGGVVKKGLLTKDWRYYKLNIRRMKNYVNFENLKIKIGPKITFNKGRSDNEGSQRSRFDSCPYRFLKQ